MTPAPVLGFGLLLTAAAGFVDAVGFMELGGYYTSFMSGNTTQLGAGLASGWTAELLLPLGLVVMFFIGSFFGGLLALWSQRWGPVAVLCFVLGGLCVSLCLALAGIGPAQAMLPLAAAAGAQNAVLPPSGAARLGATFITGTLFSAGQDLARALRREAHALRWLQHLLVWASLMLGAAVGSLCYAAGHLASLLMPALVYAGFLLWFLMRPPVRG